MMMMGKLDPVQDVGTGWFPLSDIYAYRPKLHMQRLETLDMTHLPADQG